MPSLSEPSDGEACLCFTATILVSIGIIGIIMAPYQISNTLHVTNLSKGICDVNDGIVHSNLDGDSDCWENCYAKITNTLLMQENGNTAMVTLIYPPPDRNLNYKSGNNVKKWINKTFSTEFVICHYDLNTIHAYDSPAISIEVG